MDRVMHLYAPSSVAQPNWVPIVIHRFERSRRLTGTHLIYPPLKVQLSIDYHTSGHAEGLSDQLKPRLLTQLERPDIMFEDQRAAGAIALVAALLLDPTSHIICYDKMVEEYGRDGLLLAVLNIMRDETKSFAHLLTDIVRTRALDCITTSLIY